MKLDDYWVAVKNVLALDVFRGASIYLPSAEWSLEDRKLKTYDANEPLEVSDVDVVVVHKALIGGMPVLTIGWLLSDWTVVFANEVFVVFSKEKVGIVHFSPIHLDVLKVHSNPKGFWRSTPHPCAFLHIPKTAGTSIWTRLAERIPSNIYFADDNTLLNYDGDINDYELVGGHILYRTLRAKGWKAPVFTTLRSPVDRLMSYLRHAIRDREYTGLRTDFDVAIAFVDDLVPFSYYDFLNVRMNEQSIQLGSEVGVDSIGIDPGLLLRAAALALERLQNGEIEFALVEDQHDMIAGVARNFAIDIFDLPNKNTTNPNFDEDRVKHRLASLMIDTVGSNDISLYRAAKFLKAAT